MLKMKEKLKIIGQACTLINNVVININKYCSNLFIAHCKLMLINAFN